MFFTIIVAGAVFFLAAWKTGFLQMGSDWFADFAAHWGLYLTHNSGAWTDLPQYLPYRDFYEDVLETAGGWMWSVAKLRPVPTDGNSHADWNLLYERLNRVLTTLQDNTCLQVILRADNSPAAGVSVFE